MTRPVGKAKPSNLLEQVVLIQLKFIYHTEWYRLLAQHLFINHYLHATDQYSPKMILYVTFLVKQHVEPGEHILTHSDLEVVVSLISPSSIALTFINTFSAFLFDLHIGQINPETFGTAFTACFSGLSGFSMPLCYSISHSSSASQSSLLSFWLSKSPFQLKQHSVSEMHSDAESSSWSSGCRTILLLEWIFYTWVCPPKWSFAGKAGVKRNLSDNLNAVTLSGWMF